jgi:3-oxoacyl-[acyl-carrier protein] reductase
VRTALVTGASRGIGRAIAESLATQGYGLTITSRKPDDLAALADALEVLGAPRVVHHPADMADRQALSLLAELHDATYRSMNALVLNAGVGTAGNLVDFPLHRLDRTIEVNVVSAVVLVQAALPLLRAGAEQDSDHGSTIVGLGSIAGVYAEPGLAVYGASKAALISLLNTVNLEESGNGVKATAIAPSFVGTDMSAWTTDTIPTDTMIRVSDVVAVVNLVLGLSRLATIPSIVLTRSGSNGYGA